MSLHSKCKAAGCEELKHWCMSCGMPETPTEFAKEAGYCSAECAIPDMAERIRELEAEVKSVRNSQTLSEKIAAGLEEELRERISALTRENLEIKAELALAREDLGLANELIDEYRKILYVQDTSYKN